MGDAQSAQREDKEDAAEEEEEERSGQVEDAGTEHNTEDKPLKNNGQISEINGKVDVSIAEVNGACEDEIAAEAIISPGKDVLDLQKPLEEEERLETVEMNEKESAEEDVLTDMDAKQNDINEGFKRFFSNIGLKLTVKRGSGEIPIDAPDETEEEEPNRAEDAEETAKETECENAEQNTDLKTAPETYDNDSTTCPTMTDATSEEVLENVAEKTIDTKEEAESDNAEAETTSPEGEETTPDTTPEEEQRPTSPSSPEEVVVSPIKRFFTTGIFSGLRKKKKASEDQAPEKELVKIEKKEAEETTEQTVQVDEDEIDEGVVVVVETEQKENEVKEEILSAASAQTTDEGKSPTTDPSTTTASEHEVLNSLEKEKVQASPLRRLLSGSSLKRLSKKPRSSKSSDAKLSDSGEHVSDHIQSSTESTERKEVEKSPAQAPEEAAPEEDGAWASFKKLLTPKRRMRRPNDEAQIPAEEPKPSEGEQVSDHSTEEGKKRKDSSVSWEAVLCGSGRRRSRKTSDSEEETPDNKNKKEDGGSKQAEAQLESSHEVDNEIIASSPKQAGSPSEGDAGSTWKSLKRLVTPKRKAKEDDEGRDNVQSDSEVSQDEPSFSIKKLLPGRKKRKSAEKPEQVSSDEADKDVASGEDEDSDTPAVVPLSEFDTPETEVQIQTQADVESHVPEEEVPELQQDLIDQIPEPVQPCENLQVEVEKVQENVEESVKKAPKPPPIAEEPDDLTESITKHKQLSDIPEEGAITDTMATPGSINEEVFRDDTIADDLIEITSEAVTAPEPVDTALTDETEMISAVSQLSSESSKTSGNTTPVPAEYDVQETDALLNQVVETISTSPKEAPVFANALSSERIDGSDLHADLKLEELDGNNELAATAQTESTSEVSTEIISEVPTEEFDSAEIAPDEEHEVKDTHTYESFKELESIDGSLDLFESFSAVCSEVSTDVLPEGKEMIVDESSPVEASQNETEPQKIDSQEDTRSAGKVAEETEGGAMEQEVQTVPEKEDQIMDESSDQIQHEDEVQATKEAQELQDSAATDSGDIVEKEVILESKPVAETVTDEGKEESPPGVDVSEKDEELETEAVKTEDAPEELESVKTSSATEICSVQPPEEDISPAETATDEPKQIEEDLPEVSAEPESKELPDPATTTEPETSQVVQVSTLDSGEGQLEKEVTSEAETVKDEPKQETVPLPEVNTEPVQQQDGQATASEQPNEKDVTPEEHSAEKLIDEPKEESVPLPEVGIEQEGATKTDHDQEPEGLQTTEEPALDLEKTSEQSGEKEEQPDVETVIDEPKEDLVPLPVIEQEGATKTEDTAPLPEVNTEPLQQPQVLQDGQAKASEQPNENDVTSEAETSEAEKLKDEPKEESVPLPKVVIEQEDATKTDHDQEPEVQTVKEPALDLEKTRDQSSKEEEQPDVETVMDEPKEDSVPPPKVIIEQEDATKTDQDQEQGLQTIEGLALVVEKASEQSGEKEPQQPDVETVIDEPKEDTVPLPEVNTEPVQQTEVLQHGLEKDVTSEEPSEAEKLIDEPKEDSVPLPEAVIEQEDASKTDHDQEPEGLQSVEEPALNLEKTSEQSAEKEEKPDVDEPKEETVYLSEGSIEPQEKVQVEEEHVREDLTSDGDKPIASVPSEVDADQKTESIPQDVQVEQVDHTSETTEEQTITAACVSYANEEVIDVQVREKVVLPDEIPAPSVDEAAVTDESSHEVNVSAVQANLVVEKERELQGTEIKTAAVEHAIAAQVITCNLKDALPVMPDVEIQKTSSVHEPLIDRMESEVVIEEEDKAVMVDITSAETIVDSVLEVGVTETREAIDVCHETLTKVENISAMPETEEEVMDEENKVTSQEVTLHVKENLPETEKQPDAAAEESETVKRESNEAEEQKLMDSGAIKEKLEEMSKDLMQTSDPPGSLMVSTHDHKVESEETKAEKSESGVTAEVKPVSEEQAPITQIAHRQIVTANNAGVVVPQNTGIISSIGNVESPSSLSLEFKLNIQFGQAKTPSSPPPVTERVEPVRPTDVSKVGVQAEEPATTEKPTQKSESQTQTEITEVAIKTMEIKEAPAATDSDTKPIPDRTLPLDVGMEKSKTEDIEEQIKPAESVTSAVQATETIQPVMQAERSVVILTQPVLSALADSRETKAEEPGNVIEDENEQDVWLDAEEGIYTQEELPEQSEQEEKAAPEHEVDPESNTEEGKSHVELHETGETAEIESEGEDFAVALEHPEPATASITTME